MKKYGLIRSLIHIPTLIVLFIIYYIYTRYYNVECKCNKKENFTPGIRKLYRPHIRNIRITSEGFYGTHKNKVQNFLKRVGLY